MDIEKIINKINQGGVVVLPTDTLYGLHASVFNKEAVEKIYQLKKRSVDKPLIILINSWEDLEKLEIIISEEIKSKLEQWWPGSLSVILPCLSEELSYLHRGINSLAVRWPAYEVLNKILSEVGPLVSTTVNLEGEEPVQNIASAKALFGDQVDGYLDDGDLRGSSSTLIRVQGDSVEVLRQGDVKIKLI